jgi:hypothetical protein
MIVTQWNNKRGATVHLAARKGCGALGQFDGTALYAIGNNMPLP